MSLADVVNSAIAEPFALPPRLPREPRMVRAAAELESRMRQVGALAPVELASLRDCLMQNPDLSLLSAREFKHVAHLLWDPPRLAADPAFVARYVVELRERRSGPALRRICLLWLLRFTADAPAIEQIAAVLRSEASRMRGVLADPNVARRVFNPETGPTALAAELADGDGAPAEILERHGITGSAAEGGYVLAAFMALLNRLERALATTKACNPARLRRMLEFARDNHGRPRFESARALFADALLRPFMADDPPTEVRELIEADLLSRLGDPRLAVDRWAGVSEAAKEVMLRWLAEATLEAFLAIVRTYAEPDHWRYREAFWRAYLRAGHIRSVQVAFRSQAADEARRLARKDRRLLAFGELSGYGTLVNHAVLLLRIGDLTLAEWSHNGALRIWRAGHPSAPRLTARHFDGQELKAEADLKVRHYPQGQWQAKVAEFIWHETGLRVSSSDYMPRR